MQLECVMPYLPICALSAPMPYSVLCHECVMPYSVLCHECVMPYLPICALSASVPFSVLCHVLCHTIYYVIIM